MAGKRTTRRKGAVVEKIKANGRNKTMPVTTTRKLKEPVPLVHPTTGLIAGRYKRLATLGEGTSGEVMKVEDQEAQFGDGLLALKATRQGAKARREAKLEIAVLEKLKQLDPAGDHLLIQLERHFFHAGRTCLVFPLHGPSLYDFMGANGYQPFALEQVRHIAYQVCLAAKLLHDNELTHTDIKPENVVFAARQPLITEVEPMQVEDAGVRLIDFGSAIFDQNEEEHWSEVTTRSYRAPEVVLGLRWGQATDVWSLGCLLLELCVGQTLFWEPDDLGHLAAMQQVLGHAIPQRMVRKIEKAEKRHLFNEDGSLKWANGRLEHSYKLLKKYIDDPKFCAQTELFDLLSQMLVFDPAERIVIADVLKHPYFRDCFKGAEIASRSFRLTSARLRRWDEKGYRMSVGQ